MPKMNRDKAIDDLASFYLDGMDTDALQQLAYETIVDGLMQESDADLLSQLIQHGLSEETDHA